MAYIVMAYMAMVYIVMACIAMATCCSRGPSWDLYSYGLYSHALHSYDLYSYALYSYGRYGHGHLLQPRPVLWPPTPELCVLPCRKSYKEKLAFKGDKLSTRQQSKVGTAVSLLGAPAGLWNFYYWQGTSRVGRSQSARQSPSGSGPQKFLEAGIAGGDRH